MAGMHEKYVLVYKNLGETPLEALERFRATRLDLAQVPMTYAGRLDPMAEGELLILIGEECKNKEKYLGLDKEYEVEILFGITTDTYDTLGVATSGSATPGVFAPLMPEKIMTAVNALISSFERNDGKTVVSTQVYPPYSSKTVNGKQLHALARAGELPALGKMPTKNVSLYSTKVLGNSIVSAGDLKKRIFSNINLVKGDFRQQEIKKRWNEILGGVGELSESDVQNQTKSPREFPIIKLRVKCSSGTYMRSLAHQIGKDAGMGACALSIKRTKIFIDPFSLILHDPNL